MQAERLAALKRLAASRCGGGGACSLPWYVMTSDATRAETESFFRSHSFFGLPESDVTFFDQTSLPCLTPHDGRILMATRCALACAPDGNGALFEALRRSGCLDDMSRRGVESVYVYCVDNLVVQLGDPSLVGFCRLAGASAGAKVIPKAYPTEPVGVFVSSVSEQKDQTPPLRVVEYSELSEALATSSLPDGSLRFNAANIAIHFFSLPFLEQCCRQPGALQYHAAQKKVACLADPAPAQPNALKLEAFIFDVYPSARGEEVRLLEGSRAADFAPVKNAEGSGKDSPDTARALLSSLHRGWATAAGAEVVGEGLFELAGGLTYAGEGLEGLRGRRFVTPICVDTI